MNSVMQPFQYLGLVPCVYPGHCLILRVLPEVLLVSGLLLQQHVALPHAVLVVLSEAEDVINSTFYYIADRNAFKLLHILHCVDIYTFID